MKPHDNPSERALLCSSYCYTAYPKICPAIIVLVTRGDKKDNMLRLNCFYQAKKGRLSDALAAAKELTAASLKQDGCVAYDIFKSATRPGLLLICET